MSLKNLTSQLLLTLLLSFLTLLAGCDSQQTKKKEVDISKGDPAAIARQKAALAPPTITADWIHKPKFKTIYGDAVGNLAFTAKLDSDGTPVLVTPLSFFGPSNGFKFSFSAKRLSKTVEGVDLLHPQDRTQSNAIDVTPLVSVDANHWGWESKAGDVAFFQLLDNQEFPAGVFATKELREQDRTWLVLPGKPDSPSTPQLYLVKIGEIKNEDQSLTNWQGPKKTLTISYTIPGFEGEARGLEGAPLVNRQGEIVGLQAKTATADGKVFGYAIPTSRFLPSLKTSLKDEVPGPKIEASGYTLRLPGGYKQVNNSAWRFEAPALNEAVTISLEVISNEKEVEATSANLRKIQKNRVALAAKDYRLYSTSSNPEFFSRPGLEMGMTHFSAGGPLKTGVIATGINKDELVLLSMEGNVPDDSFHVLLAEKCFYSIARAGVSTEPSSERTSKFETKTVEVWGKNNRLLHRTKTHLSSAAHDCPGETISVDFSANPLTINIATPLSLDELASQLRIGKPEIDKNSQKLVYQLEDALRVDLLDAKTTAAHLEILELDDGRLNPDKSIKFLCKSEVDKSHSKTFRKRVAEQLAKRLEDRGINHNLLSSIGKWDEGTARQAFSSLAETASWPTHYEAANALLPIADKSVIEPVANGLLHHSNLSHFEEPAGKLLQKFPDASETYLLAKLREKDYASSKNAVAAIETLAKFGGDATKAVFKGLLESELDEKILKALKKAIEDFSANPFQ